MPQFTVYENKNPKSRAAFPYLLDVQADLLSDLNTCVVVPLRPLAAKANPAITRLMPMLKIGGKPFVMCTPQLAGIPRRALGKAVTQLSGQRDEIVAAIDTLIAGV